METTTGIEHERTEVPLRRRAVVQPRYGEADVLEVRELPMPTPGEGQVLLQVHAAGVDPGVWHLMAGRPWLVRPAVGLRRPRALVPGMDVAGRVVAVGPGVERFRSGDEVLGVGRGTFATHAIAEERHLVARPAEMPTAQAGSLATSGTTALQALRDRGRVRAGHRVLIIGAGGGVGTFAVQLARELGAEVTGVCSASKVELVRSLGATDVIDYTATRSLGDDGRYDVIVDTAGRRPLSELRRVLRADGALVIVGSEGGTRILGGMSRQLRATLLTPFVRQRLGTFLATVTAGDLTELTGLLATGRITTVVGSSYPLEAAADAIREVHGGHANGKVVLTL